MDGPRVSLLLPQVSLREGCEKILVADVVTLTEQCVRGRRRALPLGGSAPCELCTGPLRNDGMTSALLIPTVVLHITKPHVIVFILCFDMWDCIGSPLQCIMQRGGTWGSLRSSAGTCTTRRASRPNTVPLWTTTTSQGPWYVRRGMTLPPDP
jgi:hypothetical protein